MIWDMPNTVTFLGHMLFFVVCASCKIIVNFADLLLFKVYRIIISVYHINQQLFSAFHIAHVLGANNYALKKIIKVIQLK